MIPSFVISLSPSLFFPQDATARQYCCRINLIHNVVHPIPAGLLFSFSSFSASNFNPTSNVLPKIHTYTHIHHISLFPSSTVPDLSISCKIVEHAIEIEKCVLVGVEHKSGPPARFPIQESLAELGQLADTAGMQVVGSVVQRLDAVNPGTYVGTGKVKEIKSLMEAHGAKTCVFDDELTPGQQRNLEMCFGGVEAGIKVIDRTALILDIFAQHATTKEGKLQVELALYQYRMPRLTRLWTHLERQSGAGGVGLRGPGETQIEVDRRLIRDKIGLLKEQIVSVGRHREVHRKSRKKALVPIISIVGYTNAGKSTLMNALTSAQVLVEDMLFATLDPTTRRATLPGDEATTEVLLTDTVGFIQKLPTQLVAAFRATLEEVLEADLLLHVVDVANPSFRAHIATVNDILKDLGAHETPQVILLNKIDCVDELPEDVVEGENAPPVFPISATNMLGIDECIKGIAGVLRSLQMKFEAVIPYTEGKLLNAIYEKGVVDEEEHQSDGTYLKGFAPRSLLVLMNKYRVDVVEEEDGDYVPEEDDEYWKAIAKKRDPILTKRRIRSPDEP